MNPDANRRLLPPPPRPMFRIVVDLSVPMNRFFSETAQFHTPDEAITAEERLEWHLTQTSDLDLIDLAIEAVNSTLLNGGHYNGITYEDIANLRRMTEMRRVLFPQVADRITFDPEVTATEAYQLDVFNDQLSRVLMEFYGRLASDIPRGARGDTLLWQTLSTIALELCQAVTILSREQHLSPVMMMNYRLDGCRAYGSAFNSVPYTYVLILSTS